MIRSVLRSWVALALVAAAGAIGTAAQVGGPIIGFGTADRTGSLSAPASTGDDRAGLLASPGALPDDGVPDIIVGPDSGSRAVRLLSGADGSELASGYPFGPDFTGGARVAYGDVTGDGVADPILAMGVGGGLVRLYNGADLTNLLSGYPFGSAFVGGVFVAVGDVSGDGRAEVITAQGQGGGELRVYNAADGSLLASGFPFGPSYAGGVRVAAGDVNGDGRAEVIAAQASGGLVSVINGVDQSVLVSGFPYGAGFSGGLFVAAGDVNADGHYDVIVAPGTGNGPVIVVDGRTTSVLGAFPAYAPGFSGGVRVAAADLTGDGRADIITAPGGGGLPLLQVFDGATFSLTAQALAYEPGFSGGVVVAAPTSSGRLRFTSASTTTFTIGETDTFSITTAGVPPATSVTETGALPDGVTFTDNGDGTATLSGTPATGAMGTYSLTFTATNGIGPNETQTFTLEVVDAAPRVTATTPADGATAIAVDSPLAVTFSEPVNVTPGAFSLQCPPGIPVGITVPTASPATQFTIDPDVDLPATTACSLGIAADQVTDADADDPPDTLAADVMVSFTTSACGAITVSPTTLVGGNVSLAYGPVTFTQVGGAAPITWSVTSGTLPAGLALDASTGVLSGTPTASGAFTFSVTATAASGCTGAAPLTLNIASGPNQAPSFAVGPNQTAGEDSGAQTVAGWATAISPGPPDEAGQTVTFTVTGNTNAALFSVAPVIAPTGTLTYMPAANASGTATITIVLQDNGGTALGGVDVSSPQSFTIAVDAVNDAPSFAVGADQTTTENAGAQTVSGWATALSAGPADEASQTLSFLVTNNTNPTLFSAGPAVSPSGELTYTLATNASGTATITLTLQDNGGTALGGIDTSAPQTFTITVTGVNSAPSFNSGPNLVLTEDSGAQVVNPWATAISPGPADEASQNVTFNVTGNTNPALFSAPPVVSPTTGALTYTPAANATGTATITLTLSDDGGTAGGGVDTSAPQTFTITVTDVNDAPSFVAGAGPTVAEDAGAQSIPTWATSISAGPPSEAGQTLTFVVTGNTNAALFAAGGAPAVSSTGTLTFTSAPNAAGTADITLVLQDNGGTAGGGVDTSAPPQTFTITVTPVNDAPSLTTPTIAYTTVGNTQLHVAGKTLPGLTSTTDAGGVLAKSGPTDVDGPAATPTAVALSNVATPNGTITLDADGSFSYVPNAGFVGTDSFTVQVTDSVTPANVTVNVTVANRVWYVSNLINPNNPAGGDGRSTNAFETLSAAATASGASDFIFVFEGDSGTTPLAGGIALKDGQKLHGEGVGLTVGAFSLVPAGTRPRITSAGDTVTVLANTANGNRTGVEIRGLDLTSTGGNAVDATSANAANLAVRISENTIAGLGTHGIDITQGSTGAATLDVHANTATATNAGIAIARLAGTAVITAFADNVVSGNSGAGIQISGAVAFDAVPGGTLDPVDGGVTLIGQSGNGVGGAGLALNQMTGALDFADLDVFADGSSAISVVGTGTFTGAAGTRVTVLANAATLAGPVGLTDLTADLQLAGLTVAGSSTNGVALTNVVGTFTAPSSASIANTSGADFNISGGTATVTYAGTITDDLGVLVSISGATGGAKTFSGAISDGGDGDGGGIALSGNTATTITFSGGLTLSTGANPAFSATSAGTVIVTDPAGPGANTIATTTGTALSVTSTTIGTGGLVFQSISSNGAPNGIVLNNTGSTSGVTVTGTGTNNSGGVIQNTTGDAIQLTSTRNISLSEMRLFSAGQSNIDATTVTGLTLNSLEVDSSVDAGVKGNGITNLTIAGGTFNRGGADAEPTCNIHGVDITNLLGTSSVTGATFTRSNTIQFHVSNTATSGNVDTLTVSGTNWNTHTGPCHGDHLSVDANGSSNFKLITTAASGENNFQGAGIGVQATAGGNGAMQASITGVQTSGNTAGVVVAATATSNISFNVFDNNTGNGTGFSGTGSVALVMTCTTSGTCQGAFTNNSIAHTAGSGTDALAVNMEGNGTGIVTVDNNTISGNFQRGIHANPGGGTGSGNLSLHITGNQLTATDPAGLQVVNVLTSLSGDNSIVNTMCLNMANNTATPAAGMTAYRLQTRAPDVFRLQNFIGDGGVVGDVETWVTSTKANAGTPIVVTLLTAGAEFSTIASCSTPTLPAP